MKTYKLSIKQKKLLEAARACGIEFYRYSLNQIRAYNDVISTTDMMLYNWCELIKHEVDKEDTWTVIPELPQYKFKNLRIIHSPIQPTDNNININLIFDSYIL